MKYLPLVGFFIVALIFNFSNILAICLDGQIDINTASAVELDKIKWVGNATAQKIIDARPFSSVDDLKRVSRLGGTGSRLSDIKEEGLACVEENSQIQKNNPKPEENTSETQTTSYENTSNEETPKQNTIPAQEKKVEFQQTGNAVASDTIKLNSKDIKTNTKSISNTKKYATYGFIAFAVFLALLFVLRRNNSNDEIV